MTFSQIDQESDGVSSSSFPWKIFAEHLGCQILLKNKQENGGCSVIQVTEHPVLKLMVFQLHLEFNNFCDNF